MEHDTFSRYGGWLRFSGLGYTPHLSDDTISFLCLPFRHYVAFRVLTTFTMKSRHWGWGLWAGVDSYRILEITTNYLLMSEDSDW
jgi:hypothetical protein